MEEEKEERTRIEKKGVYILMSVLSERRGKGVTREYVGCVNGEVDGLCKRAVGR